MHLQETIAAYFQANPSGIIAVYIFGSQASGTCNRSSDVDIAVLFDRSDPDFMHGRLEQILVELSKPLRKDVHPVIMNSAGEALLKQIFSKGRCLLVNDSRRLAEFKMTAYARIAGFDYYLKRLQTGFLRRISEVAPSA